MAFQIHLHIVLLVPVKMQHEHPKCQVRCIIILNILWYYLQHNMGHLILRQNISCSVQIIIIIKHSIVLTAHIKPTEIASALPLFDVAKICAILLILNAKNMDTAMINTFSFDSFVQILTIRFHLQN